MTEFPTVDDIRKGREIQARGMRERRLDPKDLMFLNSLAPIDIVGVLLKRIDELEKAAVDIGNELTDESTDEASQSE